MIILFSPNSILFLNFRRLIFPLNEKKFLLLPPTNTPSLNTGDFMLLNFVSFALVVVNHSTAVREALFLTIQFILLRMGKCVPTAILKLHLKEKFKKKSPCKKPYESKFKILKLFRSRKRI